MQPCVFNSEDCLTQNCQLARELHVPTRRPSSPQLQEGKGSLLTKAVRH